jgi:hypothetical protein
MPHARIQRLEKGRKIKGGKGPIKKEKNQELVQPKLVPR